MVKMRYFWFVSAALIILLAWGCNGDTLHRMPATVNIDANYGGYDTTSVDLYCFSQEPEGSTLAGYDEGEDYDDPTKEDEDYQAADNDPLARKFFLRIDWGQLRFDPQCPEPTNWDGAVSVSNGFIRILRKIAFDRHDSFIRPRTDKAVVEWQSRTLPHHDGLLVKIVVPASASGVTVTFATDPLTRTFTLDELVKMNERVPVDEIGNEVSFVARERGSHIFGAGFLAGKWSHGEFRGRWIGLFGQVEGYVRGTYGVRSDGKKVFFGKYVDAEGNFKGRLRGVWGYGAPLVPGGYFAGHWVDASGRIAGFLGGHWINSPDKVGGFMRGHYTVRHVGDPDDRTEEDKQAFPEK